MGEILLHRAKQQHQVIVRAARGVHFEHPARRLGPEQRREIRARHAVRQRGAEDGLGTGAGGGRENSPDAAS